MRESRDGDYGEQHLHVSRVRRAGGESMEFVRARRGFVRARNFGRRARWVAAASRGRLESAAVSLFSRAGRRRFAEAAGTTARSR